MSRGTIVVALGGNAISPQDEVDTIENQFQHTTDTARALVRLLQDGWERLLVTHGNGPQVGNVVRRVEHSREIAPWLPLDICVADTQGGMGYMIQQCLQNALREAGVERSAVTVVTQVEVDPADEAFQNPTKPIGPTHKLVPSPLPLRVIELDAIAALVHRGFVVVAGGGGGVPVVPGDGGYEGVEAVVDKDLTAARIAEGVGADAFVILTDVDGVYLDFESTRRRLVREVSVGEVRRHAQSGAFPPGSMGPKVEAAAGFVEATHKSAIIAALEDLNQALQGRAGTRVTPDGPEGPPERRR